MQSHLKTALAASVSIAALAVVGGLIVELTDGSAFDMQPTASVHAGETENVTLAARIESLPGDGPGPDESALRYYASLQQVPRVEAEIRRLKKLYPNWTPPDNIYNAPASGGVDEQPLWDLLNLGKLEDLRAEIDRRMKAEPGWRPSDDLAGKIRRKEIRLNIVSLFKAGKMKDIVAFIKANQESLNDDQDVDILWTAAEAYARTKQTTEALAVYQSILKNNREPDQRTATIQKAMAVMRMSHVEELLALARIDANGKSEFDSISIDITRGRISAYLHDERAEQIPEAEIKAFQTYAREAADPNQPGLVAWYLYKSKTFSQALDWFKHAISKGGDAMIAHGLAHSLRERGLYRETEEVAYAWREPLINNSILFIDILERDLTKEIPPYIEPARLLRYAQVTMDNASGEGAQGLAWYAYNSCQYPVALEWFERAVAWLPKEATVYGYALTLQKLKRSREFWEVMNRYDGLFPKVIDIIYPDDLYHPPNPCELVENRNHANSLVRAPQGFTPPAPYGQPFAQTVQPGGYGAAPATAAQQNLLAQQPAAAAYPQTPGGAYGQPGYYQNRASTQVAREPNVDRKNFPVPVDSQNPLRFNPTGRFLGQPAAAARLAFAASPLLNEPPIPMKSLVARRVPDVTRMPYERWGYMLLPGYNGATGPSGPHTASKAPDGTLWTTLQAKDAASTRQGASDPLRQDLAALLQRMASIPRVPPPGVSVTGPWRNLPIYRAPEATEAGLAVNAAADAPREPAIVPQRPVLHSPVMHGSAPAAGATPTVAPPHGRTLAPTTSPALHAPTIPNPPALPSPQASEPPKPSVQPAALQSAAPQSPVAQFPAAPEPKVESYVGDALGQRAADLYDRRMYAEAIDALDQRMRTQSETTDLRLIRAWSLMHLNRVDESRRVFGTLSNVKRAVALDANRAQTGKR